MSLKIYSAFIIFAFVIQGSVAQNGGTCHADFFSFTPRHSLNTTAFMGEWFMHEIASSDIGNFPEPDFKCAKRDLSIPDVDDLTQLQCVDSFVNSTDGTLIVEPTWQVSVNATRSPLNSMWMMNNGNLSTRIIVLAADLEFSQWAVFYSCSIRGPENYRAEYVEAMTRSPVIEPELRQFLKALMVGTGFRIGDHWPIDHTSC